MIRVSEVKTDPPLSFKTELQEKVYRTLGSLQIHFERVDNEPAITMEDCQAIDAALRVKTSKTLLLCNRQQTKFYLFVTCGDKPFSTKAFGAALGISRVSFAPESFLDPLLGTEIGATTVFSALLDRSKELNIVFDEDVLREEYYAGTDGTTTGYLRILTSDLIEKFMPYTTRTWTRIRV